MALQLSYLLSLLLLVLLLPYSTFAQSSSNQSLGLSLIAQEKGSYWASPFGDFAFGFQQIGNGGYLLAIRGPSGSAKYLKKPLSGQPMEII